jgi:parallel beta-helix repeat protein
VTLNCQGHKIDAISAIYVYGSNANIKNCKTKGYEEPAVKLMSSSKNNTLKNNKFDEVSVYSPDNFIANNSIGGLYIGSSNNYINNNDISGISVMRGSKNYGCKNKVDGSACYGCGENENYINQWSSLKGKLCPGVKKK